MDRSWLVHDPGLDPATIPLKWARALPLSHLNYPIHKCVVTHKQELAITELHTVLQWMFVLLQLPSNSALVACAPPTPAARVRLPLTERLIEIYFSPSNSVDCVSLVVRSTMQLALRPTDWVWDIKEPPRTTSSLAVTTLVSHTCIYTPTVMVDRWQHNSLSKRLRRHQCQAVSVLPFP